MGGADAADRDDVMGRQIGGRAGLAARRQIGRARDRHPAHPAHLDRAQGGILEMGDADAEIHALIDEGDDAVQQQEGDLDRGIVAHEFLGDGQDMEPPEHLRRRHGQQAARLRPLARRRELELLELRQRPAAEIEIAPAGIGEGDGPGRPVEEARGQAIFQGRHRPGDRGRRAPQTPGRGDEAALLGDGDEDGKLVETVHQIIAE